MLGGEDAAWTLPKGTELKVFLFAPPPVFGSEPLCLTWTEVARKRGNGQRSSEAGAAGQQLLPALEFRIPSCGSFCGAEGQGFLSRSALRRDPPRAAKIGTCSSGLRHELRHHSQDIIAQRLQAFPGSEGHRRLR